MVREKLRNLRTSIILIRKYLDHKTKTTECLGVELDADWSSKLLQRNDFWGPFSFCARMS